MDGDGATPIWLNIVVGIILVEQQGKEESGRCPAGVDPEGRICWAMVLICSGLDESSCVVANGCNALYRLYGAV